MFFTKALSILTIFFAVFYIRTVSASTLVSVKWNGQNTSNCRVPTGQDTIGWSGTKLSPTSSLDISRSSFNTPGANSYTFYLICDGTDISNNVTTITHAASVLLTNPMPKVNLSINNDSVNPYLATTFTADSYLVSSNQGTVLRWNFTDTNGSCVASGDWTGSLTAIGYYSTPVNMSSSIATKTYNLICTSSYGNAQPASLVVTYYPYVPSGGGGGCFTEGTMVTMADGNKKDIAQVKPGEILMSSYGPEEVMKKYEIPYTGTLYAFNGSGNYFVTPTHPFMTIEGWKSFDPEGTRRESPGIIVSLLAVGDTLIKKDGKLEKIEKIATTEKSTMVYNFGINGSHDFYADDYQVHNVDLGLIFQKVDALLNAKN